MFYAIQNVDLTAYTRLDLNEDGTFKKTDMLT
jgi:hypothetical protein